MQELRLLLAKTARGGYTVRLDNPWGGNASEPLPFKPFLTDTDFEASFKVGEHARLGRGGTRPRVPHLGRRSES